MNFDHCSKDRDLSTNLKQLNEYLVNKVFLVDHHLTLADVLLCQCLHQLFEHLSFHEKQQLQHLSRWFNEVQHVENLRQELSEIYFQRTILYTKSSSH